MTSDPICPRCGAQQSKVPVTRQGPAGSVWRRRDCICGVRFTTYEQVNTAPRLGKLLHKLGWSKKPRPAVSSTVDQVLVSSSTCVS